MEQWRLKDKEILITAEDERIRLGFWPDLKAEISDIEGEETRGAVWPEMRVIHPKRRKMRSRWEQLQFPFDDERRPTEEQLFREAADAFRASVPAAVARAVERFHWGQWALIRACRDAPRFVELIRSNPVLAMMWLVSEPVDFATPEALHAVSGTPQRKLLEDLGAEGRKSTLRILRKIPPRCFDLHMKRLLGDLLMDEGALERLWHLPKIGRGVIALAARSELLELCSPTLLLEVAQARGELLEAATAWQLTDYVSNCAKLDAEPRRFDHRYEVECNAARSRWTVYENKLSGVAVKPRARRERPFPPPPLPGTKSIQPITSREQLEEEGRRQRNCLEGGRSAGAYARKVATKRFYLYRVTWPQRCTLMIGKRRSGESRPRKWERLHLLMERNRDPKRFVKKHVDRWLESTQSAEGD